MKDIECDSVEPGEEMETTVGRIVLGFLAGAIAVLIFHEGVIYLLGTAGYIANRAWSMTPQIPPWGVPRLINNVFWGGLWGSLFALLYAWIPGGMAWLKGLVYGLFIAVISNWFLLPLIRGRYFGVGDTAFFSGWDAQRMLITIAIVCAFGLGLGIIYGLVRPRTAE
jgi:hypothetical protein